MPISVDGGDRVPVVVAGAGPAGPVAAATPASPADLDEPSPLECPGDLDPRGDREPAHAGMRTSTVANSGCASTSGTGQSSK